MTSSIAQRVVMPEWLDELPSRDPAASASRRDLQFLNFWMGHAAVFRSVLAGTPRPLRLAELGAGDGTFFIRLARRLGPQEKGARVTLVDRQPCVSSLTVESLRKLGWTVEIAEADVFDWISSSDSADCLIANLFLHHFQAGQLAELFRLAALRSSLVAACEPRRCLPALLVGSMVRWLGCNAVTQHDAPISVRAGFRDKELSSLWPLTGWRLQEQRAGLFSHLFVATSKRA